MNLNKTLTRFAVLSTLVFLLNICAYSQAAIKTANGYLFVQNRAGKSFTVEIVGKDVKTLRSENPAFEVEGRIIQFVTVSIAQITDKKLDDGDALAEHQKWEIKYLADSVFKQKLTFESEKISVGDRNCLFWGVKRPIYKDMFDRDYFITTVIGDVVFALSSPIEPTVKTTDLKKQFSDLFATIKVSDKPFDIDKMANEIKKGKE